MRPAANRRHIAHDVPRASLDLLGWLAEFEHVRGCPLRAGSHAFPCACERILECRRSGRFVVARSPLSPLIAGPWSSRCEGSASMAVATFRASVVGFTI